MSPRDRWNTVEALPPNERLGWALWQRGRGIDTSFADVVMRTERWLPASPLLVAEPGGCRFLPPCLISELQPKALASVQRHYRNFIGGFAVMALLSLLIAALTREPNMVLLAVLAAVFAAVFAVERRVLRSVDAVTERALFFHWLRHDPSSRVGFAVWLAVATAVGAAQLALQQELGGKTAVFHEYGAMYPAIRDGEYWRLVSGAYLHYSLMHYIVNVTLLPIAGWLAWSVLGPSATAVFVLGNAVAAFAQMSFGGQVFDNYGGMSGGVYALLGAVTGYGLLNRDALPRGLVSLFTGLAILGIASAEWLAATAGTVAHGSGFLFGAVAGALYYALGE